MTERPQNAGPELSSDAIFRRRLSIQQRRDGYRFSIDALLLAWFAHRLPGTKALELGAGCGVVSIALADQRPDLNIVAVEIQPGLADLARENARRNNIDRIEVHAADLKSLTGDEWRGKFDIVVANPPFRAVGRGRLNPEPEKAIARHELSATLADFLARSACCLQEAGSAAFILLAERENDFRHAVTAAGLRLLRRCAVRPYADRPANLLMYRIGKFGDLSADRELIIWRDYREYTPEVADILDGHWQLSPKPAIS